MESNCEPTAGKCKNRISPAVKLTLATFGKVPIPAGRELPASARPPMTADEKTITTRSQKPQ